MEDINLFHSDVLEFYDAIDKKEGLLYKYVEFAKKQNKELRQAEKENKRMADVVKAVNKFKWPDAREAGKIWEELYQALQALNSDT